MKAKLSALLFILGLMVGGTAVFFYMKPPTDQLGSSSNQTSEPAVSLQTPDSSESIPVQLEEVDEVPAKGHETTSGDE